MKIIEKCIYMYIHVVGVNYSSRQNMRLVRAITTPTYKVYLD